MVRVKLYGGRGRSGRPPSVVGKLGVSLFFLFFFAMGSLFEVLTLREFARAVGQQTWKETACTIVGSEVQERDDDDSPYAFTISYQYDYAGQTYTGSAYKRNYYGAGLVFRCSGAGAEISSRLEQLLLCEPGQSR